ncbi:GRAS family protein RAD1-like [Cicer arietinum]|uniref:DELLA protein RGL1-like n=1 Tax=Cicer arietinum TaxID=3827 RepID=A0A1S2Z756_CICAR|nr:DELLA protein RGL1-like [Cicer arietinum]
MEEDLNMWLSFYMDESINHDFPIRRFCPARMDQDQEGEFHDQETVLDEIELCTSEIDDFVDSFINMDPYEDQEESLEEKKHQSFDHFIVNEDNDDGDAYSMMVINDVIGYVPTIMEDEELEICENTTINMESKDEEQAIRLGMNQGLDLVHTLLACAEAVGCRDTHQANLLLNKIWSLANPSGDSLQRVSYCFAKGLKCRLSLYPHNNVLSNGTTITKSASSNDVSLITWEKKLEAFKLLYQTTPYIAFGYMAANEAICQASKIKSSIHIIDLRMEHTFQWPSLIRNLASRPEGPPKLRITGFNTNEDNTKKLQTSMSFLVEEASSFGIVLEFCIISEAATPSLLTIENLKLRKGESLVFNSILQLHKYVKESRGYLKEILQSIKKLSPITLTVVEQDTNHNGPFFLGRFLESLHYYSAIFDSLEATMVRNSAQRMKIERVHFADEICNVVAYEGPDRIERHERVEQWRRQLGRGGFQVMPLKCTSQARMMLSVYDCDGYTLSCEKGCLLLGWKGRSIIMASAWQVSSLEKGVE